MSMLAVLGRFCLMAGRLGVWQNILAAGYFCSCFDNA
jgi:hypothetical protein